MPHYPRSALLMLLLALPPASAQDSAAPAPAPLTLGDLLDLALARNPDLAQAGLDIEIAQGQARQAKLYLNPMVSVSGDELGATRGRQGGMITTMMSQEFITAGKRRLDRRVAERKTEQTTVALARAERTLRTTVRQGFYEVLTARQMLLTLYDLEKTAAQTHATTKRLVDAQQVAPLDLLQVEVELDRVRADLEAARHDAAAAWRRLAATVGEPQLAEMELDGDLEAPLPGFDYAGLASLVAEQHPEVVHARVGIGRAESMLHRQRAEAVPNFTVGAGYMRDNHEKLDEWMFQVGMPVPVFNRNQGNIQAARAEVGRSISEVERVQNMLLGRLAAAYGAYGAAKARSERYRQTLLPAARRAYSIALEAFQGGQFDYLRVLQAQRAAQQAALDYFRALGEAQRALSEIEGLAFDMAR